MPNTSKNNKQMDKRFGPKKSVKSEKFSVFSDQKENRPKRTRAKKNSNSGSIMKKQKRAVTGRRQNNSRNRINSHEKRMPSLSDLEKMFEDSDDDFSGADKLSHTTQQLPTVIEHISTTLSNTHSTSNTLLDRELSPPRKRIKLDECLEEIEDLPSIVISPNSSFTSNKTYTTDTISQVQEFVQEKPQLNPISSELVSNKETIDIGDESDNSTDSNKTIEYEPETTIQKEKLSFSPIPSTSKDNDIFIKNDKLFNETIKNISKPINSLQEDEDIFADDILEESHVSNYSLQNKENQLDEVIKIEKSVNIPKQVDTFNETLEKEIDLPIVPSPCMPKEEESDIEIIEIPVETIVIGSNIKEERPIANSTLKNDDDDDCVFISSTTNTVKKESTLSEVIDLEYSFNKPAIDNFNPYNDTADECIDVDALIAENESVLGKYKQSKSLDTSCVVIDVDVTRVENVRSNENQRTPTEPAQINVSVNEPSTLNSVQNQTINSNLEMSTSTSSSPRRPRQNRRQNNSPNSTDASNLRNLPLYQNDSRSVDQPTSQVNRAQTISDQVRNFFGTGLNNIIPLIRNPQAHLALNRLYGAFPTLPTLQNITQNQHHPKKKKPKKSKNNPPQTSPISQAPSTLPEPSTSQKSGNLGDCPICMESLSGNVIASTICGHVFCMHCIQTAIKTNKRCPTCRKMIKNNGYHQIFL